MGIKLLKKLQMFLRKKNECVKKKSVWNLAEISFTERNRSVHNNIYLLLVVVLRVPWVVWAVKCSFSGCGDAGSPAWPQPKTFRWWALLSMEQWDTLGHLPSQTLQSGYPAGCVIHAVMSVPPARAGGAEKPSGICGQILLLLCSHSPITVSRMSSVKYTKVVTIPCGVHVGLDMPELMKALSQRFMSTRVKPFPS